MQDKFLIMVKEHESRLKKYNTAFNAVGYIKLFIALLIGALLYYIFSGGFQTNHIAACAVMFIVLVIFWVYHNKLNDNINYSKGIISVCNQHIDRINGNWTAFEDIGREFVDAEHAYACDLDVVGQKSLFQFLNTTNTWHGRQIFANDLLGPAYGRQVLQQRQDAVAELSRDIDFSSKIQYYFSKIGVNPSADKLVNELKYDTLFINNKLIKALLNYIPVFTLVFFMGIIIFQQKNLYFIVTVVAMIQGIIWIAGLPKTQKYLGIMANMPYKLSSYSAVIDILKEKDFSSERLKEIQAEIDTAAQAIRDLGKLADKIDVRRNGIIYFLANTFLLWDYGCAFLLEDWKRKYSHLAEQWFVTLGEFESLLSLSHLPNVCDNTCLPVISEKREFIEAENIGHPLLSNEIRVNNSLRFNNNIFIISGSNMSGKTTFLRTVGINLVLARSGGFVCAEQMACYPLNVITSMRITDNLNEGISTFYAELKRIKCIIEYAEKEEHLLFLIDEIFRGTNSIDRLTGARTVISKLNSLGAMGMISTHDLELCELADSSGRIDNYSFMEHYRDNQIYFDYKMKQGQSKTTNAEYLMKMVGII